MSELSFAVAVPRTDDVRWKNLPISFSPIDWGGWAEFVLDDVYVWDDELGWLRASVLPHPIYR